MLQHGVKIVVLYAPAVLLRGPRRKLHVLHSLSVREDVADKPTAERRHHPYAAPRPREDVAADECRRVRAVRAAAGLDRLARGPELVAHPGEEIVLDVYGGHHAALD